MKTRILCLVAALTAAAAPARALVERTARDDGATTADFDGDGKADLAYKFDGGTWRIDYAGNGFGAWDWSGGGYGGFESHSVPADYDADGKADLSVKTDAGEWYIDYAGNGFGAWDWSGGGYGNNTGVPVPADYDGDGRADLSVKGSDGKWYIDYAAGGFGAWNEIRPGYGDNTGVPVPADYDGDRRADLSVKGSDGKWYIDYARDGFGAWNAILPAYGPPSSHPVPADYDGDGKADLSVKTDAGEWFIDYARDGFGSWNATYTAYGPESSRGLPADFDGDRKADLAVKEDCGRLYIDFAADGFGRWNGSVATASVYDNQRMVTDVGQLKEALTADLVQTIWVNPDAGSMDLTGERHLPLRSCAWLRGRREKTLRGPLLYTDDDGTSDDTGYSLFVVDGNGVRVEGLRLRGAQGGRRSNALPGIVGISVVVDAANHRGFNLLVENNEMNEWTRAAVNIDGTIEVDDPADVPPETPLLDKDTSGIPHVTGNYLHDNARDELGYGVFVGRGAYALIETNTFDYNRHSVASDGRPHTGYLAFHNLLLQGQSTPDGNFEQHLDVHGRGKGGFGGPAGEYYEIAYNTIRGEQNFGPLGTLTRAAFMLRGKSAIGSFFHDNVVVHDSLYQAVWLEGLGPLEFPDGYNLFASGNAFDGERWRDMGVGDFDADGRTDVLLATGKQWFYSSAGQSDWRFLAGHSERIGVLRFGQFDDLPGTDVFVKDGNRWFFSSGGSAWWQALRSDITPLADLLFGDFDGNGKTDVLRTDGASWYLSRDARGPWESINTSTYRAASLRVGDFDGDGRDDVFSLANGSWSFSRGAQTRWERLNNQLASSLSGLVFQDFNADGFTDVARASGGDWQYSSAGQSGWVSFHTPATRYQSFADTLFGDFTGDGRCDALRFEVLDPIPFIPFPVGTRFVAWRGLGSSYRSYSWNPMR